MPKSLADGRTKVTIMSEAPADLAHPTITELNAGIEASCAILSNGFSLGATASDTVDEKALCDEGNVKVMTASNYEGSITAFRYFTEDGKFDPLQDQTFQALKNKGEPVWIAKRLTSKRAREPWAVDDEVQVYKFVPDNWQDAEATGYIKKVVPGTVEEAEINGKVAAAA